MTIKELKEQYLAIQSGIDQANKWIAGQKQELQKVIDKLAEHIDNNKIAGDYTKDIGEGVKLKSAITLKPIIDKGKMQSFTEKGGRLPDGLYVTKQELSKPVFKKLLEDKSEEAKNIKESIGASYEQTEKISVIITD